MDRYQRFISDRLVVKKRKSLRHSCKEFQCTTSERHRFGLVWLGSDRLCGAFLSGGHEQPLGRAAIHGGTGDLPHLSGTLQPALSIAEEIRISLRILGEIDAAYAKAKWGSSMRGTLPKISQNGLINIKVPGILSSHRIV